MTDRGGKRSYALWGGLPEVLAATEDIDAARLSDPALDAMFGKLDQLDASIKGFDSVAVALQAARLSAEEVCRINSPLLDGLWKLTTANDADGKTEFEVRPATTSVLLERLVYPRSYISTAKYLLERDGSHDIRSNALIYVAGTGNVDMLALLLQNRVTAETLFASLRAAIANGHLPCVELLLEAVGPVGPSASDLIEVACVNGHAEVYRFLVTRLGMSHSIFELSLHDAAHRGDAQFLDEVLADHAAFLGSLSERILESAYNTGRPDIVKRVLALWPVSDRVCLTAVLGIIDQLDMECMQVMHEAGVMMPLGFGHYVRQALQDRLVQGMERGTLTVKHFEVLAQFGVRWDDMLDDLMTSAVEHSRADLLQYLFQQGAVATTAQLYAAAAGGNQDVVNLVLDALKPSHVAPEASPAGAQTLRTDSESGVVSEDCFRAYQAAAAQSPLLGLLALTQSDLHPEGKSGSPLPCDELAISAAIWFGNVSALEVLFEYLPTEALKFRLNDAILSKHVPVLDFICTRQRSEFEDWWIAEANQILCMIMGTVERDELAMFDVLFREAQNQPRHIVLAMYVMRYCAPTHAVVSVLLTFLQLPEYRFEEAASRLYVNLFLGILAGRRDAVLSIFQTLHTDPAKFDTIDDIHRVRLHRAVQPYQLDAAAYMPLISMLLELIDCKFDGRLLVGAAEFGRLDVVQLLVSRGVAVQAVGNEPLRRAVKNGHGVVAAFLISKGVPRSGQGLSRLEQAKLDELLLGSLA